MWIFEVFSSRRSSPGWNLALCCLFAVYLLRGCGGLEDWTKGGQHGKNTSRFSVPVMLLLTEIGVAREGVSDGTTPPPANEHEDDNSLGYTGTATAAGFPLLNIYTFMTLYRYLFANVSSDACAGNLIRFLIPYCCNSELGAINQQDFFSLTLVTFQNTNAEELGKRMQAG